MNDDQREQIRANAKYLQQVRPIDPDEICEYVEGQPHPSVVRRVLRESAVELGLIERADGTFVPAPTGQAEVAVRGVDRLPERYERAVEDVLVGAYGPGWPDGETGDRLRARIREFKEQYLHGSAVEYDALTARGYAIYHLPAYYAAVQYVLGDLIAEGLVPASPRILDVGAGVGGPALGIADLFPDDALVEYHAVEPSPAADVLDRLLEETGRNVHATIHRTTAEAFEPDGEYDVVLFANVLSELSDPAAVVGRYGDAVTDEGSIVALAPADRNTATELRKVERAVEGEFGLTVYAPTVRLWPDQRPESESWSFEAHPDIDVPTFQRRLDDGKQGEQSDRSAGSSDPGDGEFVNVDVQYAYGIWRTDGRRRLGYRPDPDRVARMADADEHVTDRLTLAGVKLSHDLSDGDNRLYLVGDGSQRTDHFAVHTRESALNRDLRLAEYGDGLRFENVLVLWNEDESAYNLVVDAETVVDRIPA